MAKILVCGSYKIVGIPAEVERWLEEYTKQGHEFIVGGSSALDNALHRTLSGVGAADKTTVYCMGYARYNKFNFKVREFDTVYDAEKKQAIITEHDNSEAVPYVIDDVNIEADVQNNREWYEYLNNKMIDDCDAAIILYDGESKTLKNIMQKINIKNKPCYTFTLQV